MSSTKREHSLFARMPWNAVRRRAWRDVSVRDGGAHASAHAVEHGSSAAMTTRSSRASNATAANSLTLAGLRPGETATIQKFSTSNVRKLHLMEMGLTPGTAVKVMRVAAFGGPLDIMLRGYRLSLRREEAECVLIKHEAGR